MQLRKYQALGNDFLILLDLDDSQPVDGATARALCDRHRGVGADGLIRLTALSADADVTMELFNADGGRAETSGNGLRCLARAVFDAGYVTRTTLTVATEAGVRRVSVGSDGDLTVDMGTVLVKDMSSPRQRMALVDVGNPHLAVQVDDLDAPSRPPADDRNVELVTVGPEPDELHTRIFERGVGETLSCGSGACAAAAAANEWGLVGTRVLVHQPGGALTVELNAGSVLLTGPAEYVGTVDTP